MPNVADQAPLSGLALTGVSVRLGDREVLDTVDISAPRGQVTALMGPNGAGKSTVLRATLGHVRSEGSIRLHGEDLRAMTTQERARRVAWVPQRSQLGSELLVEQVVAQGRFAHGESLDRSSAGADVERALGLVHATHLRGRRFPTLSGGEQQRVLLARALATGAEVLLLDEPTAALDLGVALDTLALLRGLAAGGADGRVVVAVLHGLHDALRFTDRVALLLEGKVVSEGPTAQVLTPEAVRRVWNVCWEDGTAPTFARPSP